MQTVPSKKPLSRHRGFPFPEGGALSAFGQYHPPSWLPSCPGCPVSLSIWPQPLTPSEPPVFCFQKDTAGSTPEPGELACWGGRSFKQMFLCKASQVMFRWPGSLCRPFGAPTSRPSSFRKPPSQSLSSNAQRKSNCSDKGRPLRLHPSMPLTVYTG